MTTQGAEVDTGALAVGGPAGLDGVRYEFSLRPHGEGSRHAVLLVEGTARWWDDQQGGVRLVGAIRGQRLDLLAVEDAGLDQGVWLRGISPQIAELADQVLAESRCELPPLTEAEAEPLACECILYLSELWVDPELRGRGIGSQLLHQMGGALDLTRCLLALKAAPLASDYPHPVGPTELERVRRFYLGNGFEPVGEGFMVKDARQCEAIRRRLAARAKLGGG